MYKQEKYSSYRDSGIKWIGQIPTYWVEAKLKWLSKRYAGGTPDKNNLQFWENGTIPWIASGEVNQDIVTKPTTKITEQAFKKSSAKWIPKGSLIVALAGQGKTKGMVAYLDIDTTGNQSLSAVIPNKKKVTSKYLYYFIKAAYKELRGSAGDGQRDGLNLEKLGVLNVVYPPKNEQIKIVEFLDKKVGQLKTAIKEKEQMIELLKEQKQVVINNAVTKGLNKNIEFMDSGIVWLGQKPKHWEVIKFKHLFSEKKKTHNVNLNCGSISFGKIVIKDDEKIPVETKASYQVLNKGEFLINPLNLNYDLKSLRIGLSELDVVVSSGYIIVKNKIEMNKKYFNWLLHRYDIAFMKTLGAGVRQTLNFSDIGETLLVNPPLEEQEEIANYLEIQTTKIDKTIELQENYIEKLKEYKVSLIDSVVTGKVKVA